MKLTVETKAFALALNQVGLAAAKRTTLPILSSVKLEVAGDALTISGTDLDVYITRRIGVTKSAAGATVIGIGLLARVVNRVTNSTIDLKLNGKILEFSAGEISANLEVLDADDFPENLKLGEMAEPIKCQAETLLTPLRMVENAIAIDPGRPQFAGVNLRSDNGETKFAASDGRFICVYTAPLETKDLDVIILREGVVVMTTIFDKIDEIEFVTGTAGYGVKAVSGDLEVRGKFLESKYPNYESVFPEKPFETAFSARRKDLIEAMKTASVFLTSKEVGITMRGKGKEIVIACQERGKVQIMGTELSGQPKNEILFQAKFVLTILSAMREENARIEVNGSNSQLVFREGRFRACVQALIPPKA